MGPGQDAMALGLEEGISHGRTTAAVFQIGRTGQGNHARQEQDGIELPASRYRLPPLRWHTGAWRSETVFLGRASLPGLTLEGGK